MTKENLEKFISIYRETENSIPIEYKISNSINIYNKYNYLIHMLLVELFGEKNTDILEHYIFEQIKLSSETLYNMLNKN